MTWLLGVVLDHTPWWAWALAALAALAATYQLWWPIWLALPTPVKAGVATAGAAILAYLAGRNRGASGALARERAATEAAKARAVKTAKETKDEVDALAPADLDHRLDPWMRDRR